MEDFSRVIGLNELIRKNGKDLFEKMWRFFKRKKNRKREKKRD